MSITVLDFSGKKVGSEEVPASLQSEQINNHLIWEVVNAELANKRQGTHKTKERGEVKGGGAKPWRQKGTGRARAGTPTSPIWRGGGVAFGPRPRDYRQDISPKKKKSGIKNILIKKIQEQKVIILDSWSPTEPSVKGAYAGIDSIVRVSSFSEAYFMNRKVRNNTNDKRRKITLVVHEDNVHQKKSIKNLPWVQMINCNRLAALPLHYNHGLIFTKEAFASIAEKVGK